jgi:hypothetical protein
MDPTGLLCDVMTYKITTPITMTPYAVHLKLASNTSVSTNNPVPYSILTGTSGHGVTVNSGVISLPEGEWLLNFSLQSTTALTFTAKIYKDNVLDTDFPYIKGYSTASESEMQTTSYTTSGDVDIKLVVDSTTTYSEDSDLLIYGVKT